MTEIISNGSKWAGEKPDSIKHLVKVLSSHVIEDRFFFKFKEKHDKGKFEWVVLCPITKDKETGCYHFFGNFEDLSHVFNIKTDDQKVIKMLKTAIMNNEGWKKYISILKEKA
jgi:hypothetical protein